MTTPRRLTAEEAALWAKVARTVQPLQPSRSARRMGDRATHDGGVVEPLGPAPRAAKPPAPATAAKSAPLRSALLREPAAAPVPAGRLPLPQTSRDDQGGLDSHWERRIRGGGLQPDFTLDLHGTTLDGAYHRLNDGLAQARAMGARVVLLIAGKPRPVEAADRGERRGAIRAKVLDWLAAGPHASHIAAIRRAHPRHGGEGALYVVLRRG
ncbi:Smr/MutS family protein [Porphyrobacter sp. GA68]|uniref:Smr/MutS family protein n=1 Tax=Porphyrobacter sp. GA68 TaxID=2883480 RepID=UPI001D181D9F|nr:Smr/MutS family protein [Porphyrobacter sp. GA68]